MLDLEMNMLLLERDQLKLKLEGKVFKTDTVLCKCVEGVFPVVIRAHWFVGKIYISAKISSIFPALLETAQSPQADMREPKTGLTQDRNRKRSNVQKGTTEPAATTSCSRTAQV